MDGQVAGLIDDTTEGGRGRMGGGRERKEDFRGMTQTQDAQLQAVCTQRPQYITWMYLFILTLFSRRLQDTNEVIWTVAQTTLWPLHAHCLVQWPIAEKLHRFVFDRQAFCLHLEKIFQYAVLFQSWDPTLIKVICYILDVFVLQKLLLFVLQSKVFVSARNLIRYNVIEDNNTDTIDTKTLYCVRPSLKNSVVWIPC